MNRREFIGAVGSAAVASPLAANAQTKIPRVGALVLTDAVAQVFGKELREGMRELGYAEGQGYVLEIRSADGVATRLAQLASELVQLKVDVIVAVFTPCALAARQATSEIPIVLAAAGDPVGTGLVASLARPGGNVTGLSNMAAETAGKSVELFRDMLPSLHRVAVLANPDDPFSKSFLEQLGLTGRTAGIEIAPIAMVRTPDQLEGAFASIAREQASAVVVQAIFFVKAVADFALKYRLPSASVLRSYADIGGLISYGADLPHIYRRSAAFVQKILQGARAADLPVEQPTKFELAINLRTAKAMGLRIPESFLLRADAILE
jgi:putative tryptophan/tyrosine transport system substrate-binding protein